MSRWSRRKQQAREEVRAADPAASPSTVNPDTAPELPPVEELSIESDYSGFFHPKVDEALRRAALKKLFSDPQFSLIDGMDIYIDDYSISDPLPAAMLAELKQAQKILGWAKEDREAEAARELAAANPAAATQPAITDATTATPDPAMPATATDEAVVRQELPDDGSQNT